MRFARGFIGRAPYILDKRRGLVTACRIFCLAAAFAAILFAADRAGTLRHAAALIDAGDLSGAETALQPLLKAPGGDALALNLLGIVRMREGKKGDAESILRKAAELGPRLAGPHINLGMLYGPERADNAIAQFREALRLAPHDEMAKSVLRDVANRAALAATHAGDNQRAVAVMLQACGALPHDADLLYQFGLVAMQAGLFADATKAEHESLQIRPEYPDAVYALARALLGDSKGQEAEEQFRRYLKMRPNDATAHYGLGYVLVSEQKLAEAKSEFERSLALQPNQTESVFQLGLIATREGNRDAARDLFAKVLARDPRHAGALTENAVLLYAGHKYDEAAAMLQRAIAGAPKYQKAHYYLALTYAKLGRKEESQREFETSNELKKSAITERLAAVPQ